jgi:spermidine/putrescine-binding protein
MSKIIHILPQGQYDKIYSYFKTTTEPFDYLEWDGKNLQVWNKKETSEFYKYKDLKKLIKNL